MGLQDAYTRCGSDSAHEIMNSGSGLVEAWIPDGGLEIQRRKVKSPDGGSVVTECLVPKW